MTREGPGWHRENRRHHDAAVKRNGRRHAERTAKVRSHDPGLDPEERIALAQLVDYYGAVDVSGNETKEASNRLYQKLVGDGKDFSSTDLRNMDRLIQFDENVGTEQRIVEPSSKVNMDRMYRKIWAAKSERRGEHVAR